MMKKIRKAVIPIAGMGTRFLPVTKSIPKEMLPIVNIPTIEYIVREAVSSGIEEILFITSPYKNSVIDHFDRSYELENRLLKSNKEDAANKVSELSKLAKFYAIRQGEPLGSGHAVLLARDFIGDEPFAVMYGDDIVKGKSALKELVDVYEKTGSNVIGTYEVKYEDTYKYGIIEYADEKTKKIGRIIEKPKIEEAPSTRAGLGRYILNPSIFDVLEKIPRTNNNEFQLTDAMLKLMETEDFYEAPFSGVYYDIGGHLGYIKANIAYALDREDIKSELLEYMKDIVKNTTN